VKRALKKEQKYIRERIISTFDQDNKKENEDKQHLLRYGI